MDEKYNHTLVEGDYALIPAAPGSFEETHFLYIIRNTHYPDDDDGYKTWVADNKDPGPTGANLVLTYEGRPVATASIHDLGSGYAHAGNVCSDVYKRDMGHGRRLMQMVEKFARDAGHSNLRIIAKIEHEGFYKRMGYIPTAIPTTPATLIKPLSGPTSSPPPPRP